MKTGEDNVGYINRSLEAVRLYFLLSCGCGFFLNGWLCRRFFQLAWYDRLFFLLGLLNLLDQIFEWSRLIDYPSMVTRIRGWWSKQQFKHEEIESFSTEILCRSFFDYGPPEERKASKIRGE